MKTTKSLCRSIITTVLIFGMLILSLVTVSLFNKKIVIKAEILNSAEITNKQDSDRISVSSKKLQFNADEIFELDFYVDTLSEISSYTYQTNGFSIKNVNLQGQIINVKMNMMGLIPTQNFN